MTSDPIRTSFLERFEHGGMDTSWYEAVFREVATFLNRPSTEWSPEDLEEFWLLKAQRLRPAKRFAYAHALNALIEVVSEQTGSSTALAAGATTGGFGLEPSTTTAPPPQENAPTEDDFLAETMARLEDEPE